MLKEINLPIYTTKLTMGIIEKKLTEHNLLRSTKRKVVRHGQSINLGKFRIEFIKTNHSIQDASALAIYSPAGNVVHTGDFKVDYTPVFGDAIDLQRFAEIGKKRGTGIDVRQYQCGETWFYTVRKDSGSCLTGFLPNTQIQELL